MFTIDQLVARLKARRSASGWIAQCPAHDDSSPSLSIRESNGRILVHCHAGCEQSAVIAALRALGLWPEREERKRPRSRDWREEQNLRSELLEATWWAMAAELLAEWTLEELSPVDPERHGLTKLLHNIRLGEASMLAEFREWKHRYPEMTSGMVRAGHEHDTRKQVHLAHWLRKHYNV